MVVSRLLSPCTALNNFSLARTWCPSPRGLLGSAMAESERMGRAAGRGATRGHFSLYGTRRS